MPSILATCRGCGRASRLRHCAANRVAASDGELTPTAGRGRRHRHQLDAAAGRRRRRRPRHRGRAAQPGDPARPRRRPLRAALRRGDRGGLRGDRRVRGVRTRRRGPSGSSRSRPAPCATPPTATPSSPSCASASPSRRGPRRRARRRGSPTCGATAEDPPTEPTLVIDIGGGSTELIVGTGAEIDFHASLQAGVVRHTERHVASDPPAPPSWRRSPATCAASIEEAAAELPGARAEAGIAVAGTPTSLAAIELGLEPYDPERVHGHVLSFPRSSACSPSSPRCRSRARGDPRPAPRPGADDRRRRRDPGRGDARLRARRDPGLRARHPLRRRDRRRSDAAFGADRIWTAARRSGRQMVREAASNPKKSVGVFTDFR